MGWLAAFLELLQATKKGIILKATIYLFIL
jgi:hypothetical protein